MSFFKAKDNKLIRVDKETLSKEDVDFLAEQLLLGESILPEKIMAIHILEDTDNKISIFGLDENANIVIVSLFAEQPKPEQIKKISEDAWNMRSYHYSDLETYVLERLSERGIFETDLSRLHADFFNLEKQTPRHRFNETQRLVLIGSDFDKQAINTIRWKRLEIDIDLYEIFYLKTITDNTQNKQSERLLTVQKIMDYGFLSSLFLAIKDLPKTFFKENDNHTGKSGLDLFSSRASILIVLFMILTYVLLFSALCIRNYDNFGYFGFDLGIFDQGVWLISKGLKPFITIRGLHLLGDHLSFILYLFAPLYWAWPDARLLLILQTFFLAIGALPIYLFAKDNLKNNIIAIALAFSYLLYPALEWINWDHFHPDSLLVPLLLFAIYFAYKKKYALYGLTIMLSLLVKEDVALVVILLGIFVAAKYNRIAGISTSILAFAYFLIGLELILPHFNSIGFFNIRNYAELGATPSEIIINTITKPNLVLSIMGQESKLLYITQLLLPVSFLPFVSFGVLLISFPALFSNLVSQQGYMDSIQYHYTATIIPFIFISTIFALKKLSLSFESYKMLGLLLISFAIISNYYYSPSPLSNNYNAGYWTHVYAWKNESYEALSIIPKDAAVSASYHFVPHLAHRVKIYEFPNPFKTENWGIKGEKTHDPDAIEYILVDVERLTKDKRRLLTRLQNRNSRLKFRPIYKNGDILLLKKNR